MRTAEVLGLIDDVMVATEERFDLLAKKAGLDPTIDFVGADLRAADFTAAKLAGFNFALCDLRGSNIDRAESQPRNTKHAITDEIDGELSRAQLHRYKRLIDRYLSERTGSKRIVVFLEFLNSTKDLRFIQFAIRHLRLAAQTNMEIRTFNLAHASLEAQFKSQTELGPVDLDVLVERLARSLVANGYPYGRAGTALELSTLLPMSNGVASYLIGLAKRSQSSSRHMEEVRRRVARHIESALPKTSKRS